MNSEAFTTYLFERFGISLPKDISFEGEKTLRVMNDELKMFKTSTPKGIRASRMKGVFPKPTTNFIQLFGNLATKNVVEVDRADAVRYFKQENLKTDQTAKTGYVILKYNLAVLGIGFYKDNEIRNMLPKGRKIR